MYFIVFFEFYDLNVYAVLEPVTLIYVLNLLYFLKKLNLILKFVYFFSIYYE